MNDLISGFKTGFIGLNPRQKIVAIHAMMKFAIDVGALEEREIPLKHYHTDDMYGRRAFAEAKSLIVSKVHLSTHFTIALKGTVSILDDKGNKYTVVAPDVFITEPGTQRLIYCHDDVEWITIHSSNTTNVDEIERKIHCNSFADFEKLNNIDEFFTNAQTH